MPFLDTALQRHYQAEGIALSEPRDEGAVSFHLDFSSCEEGSSLNCPLLDTERGCTKPHAARPFECLIWPLRVMRREDELFFCYYQGCPALHGEEKRDKLLHLLREGELGRKISAYVDAHPESSRAYREHYTALFALHELKK